jgi:hypothetical protein
MKTTLDPFEKYKKEYWKKKTNKERKGEILKTVNELTGMHKKSIIRKFKRLQFTDKAAKEALPTRQGRPPIYDFKTIAALKKLWELGEKICAELLHPMIYEYIGQLKKNNLWKYEKEIEEKLLQMSLSTVKRKVGEFFKKDNDSFRKGKSTTKSASIKTIIPIRDTSWFEAKIGEGQLDTVVHCGDSLSGEMAYTLNFTDFKTYWTGLRAQMGKGQITTQKSLFRIKKELPFEMIEIHPDTGSEFINYHLKSCCDNIGVRMTRSRPNHKNDNMCVEERNGHIVRKKVGYIRVNCPAAVEILNEYYFVLCLFTNHFVAVRRTKAKVRVGSRYQRTFQKAKTPYQRMMESDEISKDQKEKLKKIHSYLNMINLKEEMKRLLGEVKDIQKKQRGRLY